MNEIPPSAAPEPSNSSPQPSADSSTAAERPHKRGPWAYRHRWKLALVGFIIYMMASGAPRYIRKGAVLRVVGDEKLAVQRMGRLIRSACRHPEDLNEAKVRRLLENDLEEFRMTEGGVMEAVTSCYFYHYDFATRSCGAAPRRYVPREDLWRKDIFNISATHSFYANCNFTFYGGDIHGRMPDSPEGLVFLTEGFSGRDSLVVPGR